MEVVVVELGLYDHVPTETESSASVSANRKQQTHFLSSPLTVLQTRCHVHVSPAEEQQEDSR